MEGRRSYNSSTASCVGIGSSRPRVIISHEKFWSRSRLICGTNSESGIISGATFVIGPGNNRCIPAGVPMGSSVSRMGSSTSYCSKSFLLLGVLLSLALSFPSTCAAQDRNNQPAGLESRAKSILTQPCFQIFDISSLWSTLSPNFIVCTIVSKSGACRAFWFVPITP